MQFQYFEVISLMTNGQYDDRDDETENTERGRRQNRNDSNSSNNEESGPSRVERLGKVRTSAFEQACKQFLLSVF